MLNVCTVDDLLGTNRFRLDSLGAVGDVNYASEWPGLCTTATWSLDVPPAYAHPALLPGRVVEVWDGLNRVWMGTLNDPQRGSPWTLAADGLASQFANFIALDASDNMTLDPNTAIDQAIARGLKVRRTQSITAAAKGGRVTTLSADALSGATTITVWDTKGIDSGVTVQVAGSSAITVNSLNGHKVNLASGLTASASAGSTVIITSAAYDSISTVADLMDAAQSTSGNRWGVDENGVIVLAPDPPTVSLVAVAVDTPGGRTLFDYYNVLFCRYYDYAASVLAGHNVVEIVSRTSGRDPYGKFGNREAYIDLVAAGYGTLGTGAVSSLLDSILALTAPAAAFTGSNTFTAGQVMYATTDGTAIPVALSTVQAGQRIRYRGVQPDPQSGELNFTLSVETVIGETQYNAAEGTVLVSSVNADQRDLTSILSTAIADRLGPVSNAA